MQDNLQESGKQNPPIAFTAAGLSLALLFSKVFGLLREMLIAKYFGASSQVDGYVAASRLPTFFSGLAGSGLSASFVPVFSEFLAKRKLREGWKFVSRLSWYLLLVTVCITVVVEIYAEQIVDVCLLPGAQPSTRKLTVLLLRVVMPYFVFVEFGTILQSILQVHLKFSPIIWWQLIPNFIIISGLIFFAQKYGILSLVVGFLITGMVFFTFLLFFVLKEKNRALNDITTQAADTKSVSEGLQKLVKMAGPVIFVSSFYPLVPMVDQYLASFQERGSVATLNYAYRLVQVPVHLVTAVIGVLLFPLLSLHAGEKDFHAFTHSLMAWVKMAVFLLVPFVAACLVLSLPIVRVFYERGAFLTEDTRRVSSCLSSFAIGILGWSMVELLNKSFFAFQDSKTPVKITFIVIPFNIVSSVLLSNIFGVNGLALAASLSALFSAVLLYLFLKRKLPFSVPVVYTIPIGKMLVCGVVLGFFWHLLLLFFESPAFLQSLEKRVFSLGLMILLGGIFYLSMSVILGLEEPRKCLDVLVRSYFVKNKI